MKVTKLKSVITEREIIQKKMAEDIGMRPQRLTDMMSGRLKGWKYRSRIAHYLKLREEILFPDEYFPYQK